MAITPDTKNWTWVLERPCLECGYDAAAHPRDTIGAEVRRGAHQWPDVLARPTARVRPRDDRWSALEYGCHVRDVYRVFSTRLRRMLEEDEPSFDNWDQDQTAVEDRYDLQLPATVADEIVVAGNALGHAFDAVLPDQWSRRGVRGDGSAFTVESLGLYLLHDPIHHLWDVGVQP